jgi:hypothetical protein
LGAQWQRLIASPQMGSSSVKASSFSIYCSLWLPQRIPPSANCYSVNTVVRIASEIGALRRTQPMQLSARHKLSWRMGRGLTAGRAAAFVGRERI